MKNIFFFLLCILLFSSTHIKAQDDDKKSTIKINLFGLIAKTISLQYEYTLNDHIGLALQGGYMMGASIPASIFNLDTLAKNSSYTELVSAKFKGAFFITPEFRYYFKGEGNKGFYLGAYYRYASYGSEANVIHRDNATAPTYNYLYNGSWNISAIGLIVGSQFHLGNTITLDWWIAGLQYGKTTINMSASGDFSTTDKVEYLRDVAASAVSYGLKGVEASMTNTDAHIKIGYMTAGWRTGLCLGFRL